MIRNIVRSCLLVFSVTVWIRTSLTTANEFEVSVEFPGLSISYTCDIPPKLNVTIHRGKSSLFLNLVRNGDINEFAPVFCMRKNADGSPSFTRCSPRFQKKEVFYQDPEKRAEISVACNKDQDTQFPLTLDGTMELENRKLYSLKKSTGNLYTLSEERFNISFKGETGFDEGQEDLGYRITRTGLKSRIQKREATPITSDVYIDVYALIEHSIYKKWYSSSTETTDELKHTDTLANIKRDFAHIFNAVNLRYKTASPRLHIMLTGYIIEDTASGQWFQSVLDEESNKNYIDASKLLKSQYNLSISDGFPLHDHVVSFTSLDIYRLKEGVPSTNLLGLAYTGVMCREGRKSQSVVQYQGKFAEDVSVTAHEIGHSLSALHDGSDGNGCNSDDNYIMAASVSTVTSTNPFSFSSCSADYFNNHVNNLLDDGSSFSTNCLLKSLQSSALPPADAGSLPGQLLTMHEQCQFVFGNDSYVCKTFSGRASGSVICLELSCYNSTNGFCYRQYAARGTTCGSRKWCDSGNCVDSEDAPVADPGCLLGDQPIFKDGETCPVKADTLLCTTTSYWNEVCCETCRNLTCNRQCQNNGYLDSTNCQCVCPQYYTGQSCESCSGVCENGGTLNEHNCRCTCPPHWAGATCETATCSADCQNGGTLNSNTCQCECQEPWTGNNCDIAESCSRTCQNGGILNLPTCNCMCPADRTGVACETKMCTKVCDNGGTLDQDACHCNCPLPLMGETCGTTRIALVAGLGAVVVVIVVLCVVLFCVCQAKSAVHPFP